MGKALAIVSDYKKAIHQKRSAQIVQTFLFCCLNISFNPKRNPFERYELVYQTTFLLLSINQSVLRGRPRLRFAGVSSTST
ncbi:MAG: hypothetical protein KDE52_10285, partial [Calditrichaeota bacterium]|nr:hypothetical protein [Calditrichota bacterium]